MHLKTDTSSNSHFARVPTISHFRNAFTISDRHLTTIQFDYLYPLYNKFIYPGDTLSISQKILARLQTQITTLFDDLYLDIHAWYVPIRLIQTDWARFQFNAQPAGPSQDNSSLTTPGIDFTHVFAGGEAFPFKSLYDYFGYNPVGVGTAALAGVEHFNNYLPRAYNLIWNDNYRDENLQNPAHLDLDNGPDWPVNYTLLKRGRRHDRFGSALTAQQKGPAVSIPGGFAPVLGIGKGNQNFATAGAGVYETGNPSVVTYAFSAGFDTSWQGQGTAATGGLPNIRADLSSALGTLNQLRQSIAVQQLFEADARGGTRDVEAIANRWGVQVPDFRLQRPEYIGGATFSFDGHIVPQTSETGTTPQANLTQFSQTLTNFSVNHSFVEHGVFMILLSCRSNLTYQQGIIRELNYKTRFDFYQPEFANLGEVAIKNKEIYFQNGGSGTNTINQATFGFQEYGYELRYGLNRVSAEMRSAYPTSLDSRHMADDYSSLPTLSAGWIASNTPISRNIAVDTETADPIQLNTLVEGRIARTLPMYSVPGLYRL